MNGLQESFLLSRRETGGLVILFVLTVIFRLVFNLTVDYEPPFLRADSSAYVLTAINLHEHGTYSYKQAPPFESSTLLVPGYPLFLYSIYSLAGDINLMVKLALSLQILMGAISTVLVYCLARMALPIAFSLAPAIFFAFYPHQIVVGSYLLTETLFTMLFLIGTLSLIIALGKSSLKLGILAGVIFSYAIITRPIILLLLPFLLVFSRGLIRKNIKVYLCAIAASFILWIPWTVWSQIAADNKESNARAVVVLGTYPDLQYKQLRGFPYKEDPDFSKMSSSWNKLFDIQKNRFLAEPGKYLFWYFVGKPIVFWEYNIIQGQGKQFIYPIGRSLYDRAGAYKFSETIAIWLHKPIVYGALFSALILVIFNFFSKVRLDTSTFIISGILLYVTAIHIPFAPLPRFSIPFQPFAFIIFSAALNYLFKQGKKFIHAK